MNLHGKTTRAYLDRWRSQSSPTVRLPSLRNGDSSGCVDATETAVSERRQQGFLRRTLVAFSLDDPMEKHNPMSATDRLPRIVKSFMECS
jgi:hypothetical protein